MLQRLPRSQRTSTAMLKFSSEVVLRILQSYPDTLPEAGAPTLSPRPSNQVRPSADMCLGPHRPQCSQKSTTVPPPACRCFLSGQGWMGMERRKNNCSMRLKAAHRKCWLRSKTYTTGRKHQKYNVGTRKKSRHIWGFLGGSVAMQAEDEVTGCACQLSDRGPPEPPQLSIRSR